MRINHAVVESEINRLYQQHGKITPEIVLAEAKLPTSPLHTAGGFEWDVNKAAEREWLHHAQYLIKTVKIEVTVEETVYTHPKFVLDPEAPSRKPVFVQVTDLKQQGKEYDFLVDEFERITAQVKRAQHFAQELDLDTDFNRLLSALLTFDIALKKAAETKKEEAVPAS